MSNVHGRPYYFQGSASRHLAPFRIYKTHTHTHKHTHTQTCMHACTHTHVYTHLHILSALHVLVVCFFNIYIYLFLETVKQNKSICLTDCWFFCRVYIYMLLLTSKILKITSWFLQCPMQKSQICMLCYVKYVFFSNLSCDMCLDFCFRMLSSHLCFFFVLSEHKKNNGLGSYGGGGVTETHGGRRGDRNWGWEEWWQKPRVGGGVTKTEGGRRGDRNRGWEEGWQKPRVGGGVTDKGWEEGWQKPRVGVCTHHTHTLPVQQHLCPWQFPGFQTNWRFSSDALSAAPFLPQRFPVGHSNATVCSNEKGCTCYL